MFFSKHKKNIILNESLIPYHVAFIMDGNGRWAQNKGLPREVGHAQGAKTFRKVVSHCAEVGIKCVTVYAFSTENWKRPQKEVDAIMNLLDNYLDTCEKEVMDNNIEIHFIGNLEPLSESLKTKIYNMENSSKGNRLILNVALNYGGRDEILLACKKLSEANLNFDEDTFSNALYTSHCPDPDLIVRTAGEMRLSNFLLWQAAYSEFYFTNVLWPDMNDKEIDKAIYMFQQRKRRYGGL